VRGDLDFPAWVALGVHDELSLGVEHDEHADLIKYRLDLVCGAADFSEQLRTHSRRPAARQIMNSTAFVMKKRKCNVID
jgi:hypothetical protein